MDEIMICVGAGIAIFAFSVVPMFKKDKKSAILCTVLTVAAMSLALAVCVGVPLNFYRFCERILWIK